MTPRGLAISHDPISDNASSVLLLEDVLKALRRYPKQYCFFNIKEDGLLPHILKMLVRIEESCFPVFFDMSVPQLFQYIQKIPPSMLATRVSDIEPLAVLHEYCEWIWI